MTVPKGCIAKEDGKLGVTSIEDGLYAVGHFEIKGKEFGRAWDYMYEKWLMTSGYIPRNASPFEVYLNNPKEEKDHLIKVDIYVPDVAIHDKESQAEFYRARNVRGWAKDPSGYYTTGWGLSLTTDEFARIGLLCLNNGVGGSLISVIPEDNVVICMTCSMVYNPKIRMELINHYLLPYIDKIES